MAMNPNYTEPGCQGGTAKKRGLRRGGGAKAGVLECRVCSILSITAEIRVCLLFQNGGFPFLWFPFQTSPKKGDECAWMVHVCSEVRPSEGPWQGKKIGYLMTRQEQRQAPGCEASSRLKAFSPRGGVLPPEQHLMFPLESSPPEPQAVGTFWNLETAAPRAYWRRVV